MVSPQRSPKDQVHLDSGASAGLVAGAASRRAGLLVDAVRQRGRQRDHYGVTGVLTAAGVDGEPTRLLRNGTNRLADSNPRVGSTRQPLGQMLADLVRATLDPLLLGSALEGVKVADPATRTKIESQVQHRELSRIGGHHLA